MGSTSDFAKKAALETTKGVGKLLWAPTKGIGKFAWRVARALHPIFSMCLLTYGSVMLLFAPPLGAAILTLAALSYATPRIVKRTLKIAANLFPKAAQTINRAVKGEQAYGYRKALKPGEAQRPLGQDGPQNQGLNKRHSGHFNDKSGDRLWRESFDQGDRLDLQSLDYQEQLNKASHERLGTMNPFNSGGRL